MTLLMEAVQLRSSQGSSPLDHRRVNATGPFERALCRAALKAVAP